jgi:hypothetical protein
MKVVHCNWITSAQVVEIYPNYEQCPAPPCYLISVQSTSQASKASHQVPALPCLSAGYLGSLHLSSHYVLWDPDITKDGRLHLLRCVWCELPAPICSNPSFPPETTHTENADGTLLLSSKEAFMCTVHKGKKETGEKQESGSWRSRNPRGLGRTQIDTHCHQAPYPLAPGPIPRMWYGKHTWKATGD